MNTTTTFKRRSIALAAVAALGLAACGSDDPASSDSSTEVTAESTGSGVEIADPWSRQPAEGQTTSAVYGAVTNNTAETIRAVSATTSVTDTVELHEVLMNDEGQMTMQEKDGGFEIAAGETFVFEPGGPHIMLLGIDAATYPDTVDVTLTFDNDVAISFTAEVRPIGDDDMDDMGETDGTHQMDDGGEMDDGEMEELDDGRETDGDHSDDGSMVDSES